MNTMSMRSKRLAIVALAVLVLGVAVFGTGATALAATTTTNTVTATIPAGGWVAYGFDFPGPGNRVGVTLNYNAIPGLSPVDKYITMDVFQPKDFYRDDIGSAHFVREGMFFYELYSPNLKQGDRNRIKTGELDEPAAAGKYQLVVHNWSKDHPVTISLSTAYITKLVDDQKNLANPSSRQNSGYFVFDTKTGPALWQVSTSK